MLKETVAIALLCIALPQGVAAQSKQPTDIGRYCEVVEKQIVALSNNASNTNDDLAKFASDQATADGVKFAKANALLASLTESLKEKELEWYHLGCVQILYRRSASN